MIEAVEVGAFAAFIASDVRRKAQSLLIKVVGSNPTPRILQLSEADNGKQK